MNLLMWLVFGKIMSRCYDDGVHVDEELYPALNGESNPVLKNKKVSTVRSTCDGGIHKCIFLFVEADVFSGIDGVLVTGILYHSFLKSYIMLSLSLVQVLCSKLLVHIEMCFSLVPCKNIFCFCFLVASLHAAKRLSREHT